MISFRKLLWSVGLIWKRFADYFRQSWHRLRRRQLRPQPLVTIHATEVPENLEAGMLYVIGENTYKWYVVFGCPCGCGEKVQLSLLEGDRPRWYLVEHDNGTVSLSPSVWRNRGCRSHFFVRRGHIKWCLTDD
jgi:hypothetical protein